MSMSGVVLDVGLLSWNICLHWQAQSRGLDRWRCVVDEQDLTIVQQREALHMSVKEFRKFVSDE